MGPVWITGGVLQDSVSTLSSLPYEYEG